MIKSGGTCRGRGATRAFPGVQTDMVMIAACREERRLPPVTLRFLKTEHIPVKHEGAFQIGYLKMDMPDLCLGSNRTEPDILSHGTNLPHPQNTRERLCFFG